MVLHTLVAGAPLLLVDVQGVDDPLQWGNPLPPLLLLISWVIKSKLSTSLEAQTQIRASLGCESIESTTESQNIRQNQSEDSSLKTW